jgi:PAS domain S-box-containing protein
MSSYTMRFEKLLEAVPDALVGMDQKGVIRFVNHQTESLFGYKRDQLIGEPIDTLVPETLWQIYAEHQQDYFSDPITRSSGLDLQLSGRDQDGTEFPINISMSHIDTDDVLLVITAVRDVTRQQQAVANAALVEAIVEYSDDAISASTLEGTITSWNPAAARMYGYSSKEIIGRSGSVLTPPDRAGEMGALLTKIKDGQAVRRFRTTRVRKDGTVFPISLSAAPIRDAAGAIVGVAGVFRDVTEQRQVVEARKRMASIVENSDDAIIGKTLDGIITSWNPAAERLFGYSSQDVIGESSSLLNIEGGSDEGKAILTKIRAGQPVGHLETDGVRKDGTLFNASVTISPIRDPDGAVIGASVIAREVTGKK